MGTSDLNDLCQPTPCTLPPKHCYIGGVGWGMQLNRRTPLSNMQINVEHSPPHFLDKQSVEARSKIVWAHNEYENYSQDNNKYVLLNSKSLTLGM
uniref:Uncharacterized protein n=1 Tax=Oncorhynchus kisutch TaxID=8019 RepID=A0A8C7LX81_ONCKI